MNDDRFGILVCLPYSMAEELVAVGGATRELLDASSKSFCEGCGTEVVLAPSTQQLTKDYPNSKMICHVCFEKLGGDKISKLEWRVTKEQIADLIKGGIIKKE